MQMMPIGDPPIPGLERPGRIGWASERGVLYRTGCLKDLWTSLIALFGSNWPILDESYYVIPKPTAVKGSGATIDPVFQNKGAGGIMSHRAPLGRWWDCLMLRLRQTVTEKEQTLEDL